MTIANTADTTRIFINRSSLNSAMTTTDLHNHFLQQNLNTEVFRMAGRVGIDCLTIELAEVVPLLKQHGLI